MPPSGRTATTSVNVPPRSIQNYQGLGSTGETVTEKSIGHAHISGMYTFARALLVADRMIGDGFLANPVAARYAGYRDTDLGRAAQR